MACDKFKKIDGKRGKPAKDSKCAICGEIPGEHKKKSPKHPIKKMGRKKTTAEAEAETTHINGCEKFKKPDGKPGRAKLDAECAECGVQWQFHRIGTAPSSSSSPAPHMPPKPKPETVKRRCSQCGEAKPWEKGRKWDGVCLNCKHNDSLKPPKKNQKFWCLCDENRRFDQMCSHEKAIWENREA